MMTPRSPSTGSSLPIAAAASRIMLNEPTRFTRITLSKSASGCGPSRPMTRVAVPMPAQLTRMRAGPCAACALAIAAVADFSSATSPTSGTPPSALAASSAAAGLRSKTATRAPFDASASAVARPNPDPPPVTIAAAPEIFIAPRSSQLHKLTRQPLATADAFRQWKRRRRHCEQREAIKGIEGWQPRNCRVATAPRRTPSRAVPTRADEAPLSGNLQQYSPALDLHRKGFEIDAGGRALGFAGGEVEAAVVHRAFDDRALNVPVGELRVFVRADAVGGEVAPISRPVDRILAAVVFEGRDVVRRNSVCPPRVDPGLAH